MHSLNFIKYVGELLFTRLIVCTACDPSIGIFSGFQGGNRALIETDRNHYLSFTFHVAILDKSWPKLAVIHKMSNVPSNISLFGITRQNCILVFPVRSDKDFLHLSFCYDVTQNDSDIIIEARTLY